MPTSWTRDPDSAAVEIERRILTKQQAAHYIGRSDNEHVEARQREDLSQLAAPPANRQWNEGEVCAVAHQCVIASATRLPHCRPTDALELSSCFGATQRG